MSASSGCLPSFLLIGAQKSGTSSIYEYLKQHPEIYMAWRKEPEFFARMGDKPKTFPSKRFAPITTLEDYKHLFSYAKNEKVLGEASSLYLYHARAAENIHRIIPDVKLIAILRNPIERAFSHYVHNYQKRMEPVKSFEKAIFPIDQNSQLPYLQRGLYFKQLERYFRLFPSNQIRILFYEELEHNPKELMEKIYKFLNVSSSFEPDISVRYNVGAKPRLRFVDTYLRRSHWTKRLVKRLLNSHAKVRLRHLAYRTWTLNQVSPTLHPETKLRLVDYYLKDIEKLEGLLRRSLKHWTQIETSEPKPLPTPQLC